MHYHFSIGILVIINLLLTPSNSCASVQPSSCIVISQKMCLPTITFCTADIREPTENIPCSYCTYFSRTEGNKTTGWKLGMWREGMYIKNFGFFIKCEN